MNWFKVTALTAVAIGLIACSAESTDELEVEDLPIDQEQVEPAPDTTSTDTMEVKAGEVTTPAKSTTKRTVNTQAVGDPVGDGSVQKMTSKKTSDGAVVPTQKEDIAKPLDDGGIEKSTTKKKK